MNIQTIHLKNWKKFTNPIQIQLQDGLNILYGPNESGKTTLIDSVITTFYSKHTSGSGKIKSLKPWGTSLHPSSQITFTQNGEIYRITKGFKDKKSILEKRDTEIWKKIAEGDQADQQLLQLVGGQLATRGDTKPEQWGLGQTLWMVQGTPIINDNLNDETLSSLQSMVGATIESDKEKKVLNNIRSRFQEIYTDKTKTLKKGSQLKKVGDEIKTLKNELLQSQLNNNKKDELVRKIEDTDILYGRNQKNLKEAIKERDVTELEVEDARQHQKNREELESQIQGINARYETLQKKMEEINESHQEIANIQSECQQLQQQQLLPLNEESKGLEDNLKNKLQKLDATNQKIDQANDEKSIVGIAHTTVMDEQALDSMKERYREITQLHHDLNQIKEKLNTIVAPSPSQMEKIQKLTSQINKTNISLQAMGLTLNVSPQASLSGEISLDNKVTPFNVTEDVSWTANQSLKIKIDQVGEFEVKSGSQDVKIMKEELQKMQSDYQEIVAPYGTEELSDLQKLVIRKDSKEKEIGRIQADLNKRTDKSPEQLQQEIIALENKIKLNWKKIPSDSPYKACEGEDKSEVRDELSSKIILLEDYIKTQTQNRNQLNVEIKTERKTLQELEETVNDKKTYLHGKKQITEEITKRLKRLEDDNITSEQREQQLNQLSVELDQKKRAWQVYQDEIEEKEKQPLGAFEGLKNKVERLKEEIHQQEVNKASWESQLQILISQSTDTNLIEERLEQLQNNEKEFQTEADALKLLFQLTNLYRENTIGELSEPIRKHVTEDLEKLLGPKYSLVFNKQMKPESIEVAGEEASIDLLSFGTQEQVWCLFRLALGNILSSNEKQLVVLDDPLVNTDPARMHRALEILQENAQHMQIIVVTCDVDKYNSLTDANFISMDGTI
ncbi:AAA family ATPase [Methanobacterium petrolearium]|uniref:AAA family ATPase n=1 Tax=Methanobacterium petrolearium TaxID=710190 RepID=UPI001AE74111|nr:ATP-binding protein [Methanobacterium petrolearium]MBP1947030.1 DNA repair exonuclease SbcCD ATPase subunit [Methanobacterium petrolearium]BDZ71458.1 DNA repair ATPase-like protein [Methanobacterium petrolearium]